MLSGMASLPLPEVDELSHVSACSEAVARFDAEGPRLAQLRVGLVGPGAKLVARVHPEVQAVDRVILIRQVTAPQSDRDVAATPVQAGVKQVVPIELAIVVVTEKGRVLALYFKARAECVGQSELRADVVLVLR